jgi:hypothetical protein
MLRGSKSLTALAVLIPVAGAVIWAGSVAEGASAHRTVTSAAPSTAKLQKEITALKNEIPKTYLSAAKAKKTYLSSAAAKSTYLKTSTAATNLINGNGYILQGEVAIPDVSASDSQPLFATRDGLKFYVRTNSPPKVQLQVVNDSGTIQYLMSGSTETTLYAVGGPAYDLSLGNGATGVGEFTMSIVSAAAPLEIDTLNIAQQPSGSGSDVWAQLVHSGS